MRSMGPRGRPPNHNLFFLNDLQIGKRILPGKQRPWMPQKSLLDAKCVINFVITSYNLRPGHLPEKFLNQSLSLLDFLLS